MLPAEIIARKRDGHALDAAAVLAFVQGLVDGGEGGGEGGDGGWSDAQVGAMAMAIVLRGMDSTETVALTEAMTCSGEVLDWADADLPGPVLDKHSTGGVGDKVSLVLAPLLAACGGVVPMVSGRGLGHTGGTLDKLEALPGFTVDLPNEQLREVLRSAGCAIVGASPRLAPADRRLYAIRDVTATVESLPLITASILSKKRAAGLQALVMDVKCGSGAFCRTPEQAQALARSLVDVARGAGLPTVALVTDMNRVLGRSAGNALEVAEALAVLRGDALDTQSTRLRQLCLALAAEALHLAGLYAGHDQALAAAERALASGEAAVRLARMVAAQGGPRDALQDAQLPTAPVQRPVAAQRAGVLGALNVQALGWAVVAMGGGRRRPGDGVDPRVGLAGVCAPGETVVAGQALAWVHAADEAAADLAVQAVAQAMPVVDCAPSAPPMVLDTLR